MKLLKTIALLCASASILAACTSIPMGDPEKDAALKTFTVPKQGAALYVYRNERFGGAVKMPVVLDGKVLGDTGAHTYLYSDIDPGHHELVSKTENDATLSFDAIEGKIYYVWQEVKMGMFSARSELHMVDAPDGQAGVAESKLTVLATGK